MRFFNFFRQCILASLFLFLSCFSASSFCGFEIESHEVARVSEGCKKLIIGMNPHKFINKESSKKSRKSEKKESEEVTNKFLDSVLERIKKYVKECRIQDDNCCSGGCCNGHCFEVSHCNIEGLDFKIMFMDKNDCFYEELENEKTGVKNFEKTRSGVMIHSTASPGLMAKDWFDIWNLSYKNGQISREVCVHMFVDDKSVYLYFPLNLRAWHCGNSAGNDKYISIEMCEPNGIPYSDDKSKVLESFSAENYREYFDKTYKNAVIACASVLRFLNTSVSKSAVDNNKIKNMDVNVELSPAEKYNVISHKEGSDSGIASSHGDPDHIWRFFGYSMDQFRRDVQSQLISKDLIKFGSDAIVFIDKSLVDDTGKLSSTGM